MVIATISFAKKIYCNFVSRNLVLQEYNFIYIFFKLHANKKNKNHRLKVINHRLKIRNHKLKIKNYRMKIGQIDLPKIIIRRLKIKK